MRARTPSAADAPLPPALPPGGLTSLMAQAPTAVDEGAAATPAKRWRVAYVVSHPIQYQAPLLRHLTERTAVDVTALFLSDVSCRAYRDEGFGQDVQWDVDLLGGYAHEFLPTLGASDRLSGLRPINRGLETALRRGEFDAVWLHGYAHPTNLRLLAAARRLGLPILLRGESLLLGERRGGLPGRLRDAVVPRLLRRVDGCLAIGRANREFYRHHGVPDDRIFDAPYAVDNARFRAQAEAAAPQRAELRAELGIDPKRPVVLAASKFTGRKRAGDVIDAVQRLAETDPAPQLVLVGDGEQRAELEARAAAGPPATVFFAGFRNQSELPRFYDLCDLFVLPSSYEPWGLVVNEAMCAGRPAVVSDAVGSGLDLVLDGETGYRYPAGDVAGLADCIERVVGRPDLGRALGRAARERIGGFDFDAVARGLEAALERTVPGR